MGGDILNERAIFVSSQTCPRLCSYVARAPTALARLCAGTPIRCFL